MPWMPWMFRPFSQTSPTLPTITGVTLLQHAVEVGAQVGDRGEAFIEAHDAAAVLPVGNQGLPQLHEEIQPGSDARKTTPMMRLACGTYNSSFMFTGLTHNLELGGPTLEGDILMRNDDDS